MLGGGYGDLPTLIFGAEKMDASRQKSSFSPGPGSPMGGVTGAGTWISPSGRLRGSICPAVDGGIAFCLAPTFSTPVKVSAAVPREGTGASGLQSPRVKTTYANRLVLQEYDKEHLIEKTIHMRKALREQTRLVELSKLNIHNVDNENRKLENSIEELEMLGIEGAPRTGNLSRLRAKMGGLKTRLGNLQETFEVQAEEILFLRKHIHVTHSREMKVERDVYAEEIGRLQRLIKSLKGYRDHMANENKKLSRVRDKVTRLELSNQHLTGCILVVQQSMKKTMERADSYKQKAKDAMMDYNEAESGAKEVQVDINTLEAVLEKERAERITLQKHIAAVRQKLESSRKNRKPMHDVWVPEEGEKPRSRNSPRQPMIKSASPSETPKPRTPRSKSPRLENPTPKSPHSPQELSEIQNLLYEVVDKAKLGQPSTR